MSVELYCTESRPKADTRTVKAWLTRTRELVALAAAQPVPPSTDVIAWIPAPFEKWKASRTFTYRGQQREVSMMFDYPHTVEGQKQVEDLFDSEEYQRAIGHALHGWMARVDNPEIFSSL